MPTNQSPSHDDRDTLSHSAATENAATRHTGLELESVERHHVPEQSDPEMELVLLTGTVRHDNRLELDMLETLQP